ncbi:MAG: protein phosphatase [Epsilonproteobacteria bacterium]|nr:MAG: protein phosphatase [Campylobacterota bacterium]
MKTIIYGDLHGCLNEFKELRAKVNPSKEDKEIIIGDILDRGLYSNELLKYIRENNISSILGNHEYKYLRYKKHQDNFIKTNKQNPMTLDKEQLKIFNNLITEDFNYIQSLPFFIKIDNLTLIHAGLTNKIDLDTAKKKELEKILWIRTLDENQKTLSLSDDNPSAKFWSEYYDGNQGIIIYGHQPFDNIKIDKYSLGIDTGCVFGGKLTALIVTDTLNPLLNYDVVEVKAKEQYSVNKY